MRENRVARVRALPASRRRFAAALLPALLPLLPACSEPQESASTAVRIAEEMPGPGGTASSTEELLTSLDEQTPELRFVLEEWEGDLEAILEERFGLIRLLTVYEPIHYAIDGRKQGGTAYEGARLFQEFLNERLGLSNAHERVRVVIVPVRRDELIPFVRDGRGDIAAANLTITDERLAEVDFSDPFAEDAYEIVVTGPGGAPVASLDELSGRPVFVRRSSSYRESLERLNEEFRSRDLDPVTIVEVNEVLDDGAILRMIDAGALPATVVDAHVAEYWHELMPDLVLHDSVRTREGARIAWAVQKGAPELQRHINAFVRGHKKGTRLGNIVINRYYGSTDWLRRIASSETRGRLAELRSLFEEKAGQYDLDWRRLAAQAMQESELNQQRRSPRGALGLMQLMPATAREMGFEDISSADANVEAGAKYMRHVIDTYFPDVEENPQVDEERAREHAYAFALAAYNAGPTRIARIRRQAEERGAVPQLWFGEVELLVARDVGSEPVDYVRKNFEYSVQMQLQERLLEDWEEYDPSGGRPWDPIPE